MSESIECLFGIYEAVKSLGETISFFLTGLSFGIIPSMTNIEDEDDNVKFSGVLAHASQALYSLYLMTMLIVVMFYDFNSVYSIIILSLSLFTSIWCFYLVRKRKLDDEFDEKGISGFPYFVYYACTIILVVKLLVTSHEVMIHILRNDTTSNMYVYLVVSLCFESFFLLTFTLVLFMPLVIITGDKQEGKSTLTVWSMEYMDIIAHLAVCLTYAVSVSSMTDYLTGYFIIYCLNVSVFTLFLPWTAHSDTFYPLIGHTLLLDLITDLPFTIITLAGKTYVGNLLIAIDILVNIITFIRGVIWVPVKFKHDEVTTDCVRGSDLFSVSTLKTFCQLLPVILFIAAFLTLIVTGAITEECNDIPVDQDSNWGNYKDAYHYDFAPLLIGMGIIGVTETLFFLYIMSKVPCIDRTPQDPKTQVSAWLGFFVFVFIGAFFAGSLTLCIIGWQTYGAASDIAFYTDEDEELTYEELLLVDCSKSFEGIMLCVGCALHTFYAFMSLMFFGRWGGLTEC